MLSVQSVAAPSDEERLSIHHANVREDKRHSRGSPPSGREQRHTNEIEPGRHLPRHHIPTLRQPHVWPRRRQGRPAHVRDQRHSKATTPNATVRVSCSPQRFRPTATRCRCKHRTTQIAALHCAQSSTCYSSNTRLQHAHTDCRRAPPTACSRPICIPASHPITRTCSHTSP